MTVGIIGGGHAALHFVRRLRAGGFDERIEILDKSRFYPYERPALSKQAFLPDPEIAKYALATKEQLEKLDVSLSLGHTVKRLFQSAGVFLVELESGLKRDFRLVVLATGVRPRVLKLGNGPQTPVCNLQSWEDLIGIQAHLKSPKRVLIVGAGFVGLESASSLVTQGHQVVVLERGSQVMGRALGSESAKFFQNAHEKSGVKFLLEDEIARVTFDSGSPASIFEFSSGTSFAADLVLVSVGVEPATDFIDLPVKRAEQHVLVDEEGRTSIPDLFAIGDIAARPDPQGAEDLVKIQSIDSAIVSAERLAKLFLNETPTAYDQWWPKFWSDQAGQKLQISGLKPREGTEVKRAGKTWDSFSVGYFQGDRLSAVESVNAPLDFVHARKFQQQGLQISPDEFRNSDVPLRNLLDVRAVVTQ